MTSDQLFVADDTEWPLVRVTHAQGHRWLFMFTDHFGPDAPQIERAPEFAAGSEPDPELTSEAALCASAKAKARAIR